MSFHGMPQWFFRVNRIVVPTAFPLPAEVSSFTEIRDDALYRSLGDPDANGYVPGPNRGVFMDADQHVGVVGQEGPLPSPPMRGAGYSSHGITGTLEERGDRWPM